LEVYTKLVTDSEKRPISILLVILLGTPFLITFLLTFIFDTGAFAIITYFPIFIIITFILIFVNLGKNKTRTNGFIIATCTMVAILAISSYYLYHYSLSSKGTTDSTENQVIEEVQSEEDNVTETSNEESKDSEIQKTSKEKTNNEITPAIILNGRGNQSTDFFYIYGGYTFIDFDSSGFLESINVDIMDEDGNLAQNIYTIISSSFYEMLYLDEGRYFLNVEADDSWEAIIKQYAPSLTRNLPYTFTGDSSNLSDLIVIDGLVEINYKYTGSSNFTVYIINEYGEHEESIVNEIGSVSGSTTFKGEGKKYLISVERAQGSYEIILDYK